MEFDIRSTTKGWQLYVSRGPKSWLWLGTFRYRAHLDLFLRELKKPDEPDDRPSRIHPYCIDGDLRDPSLAPPTI